MATKAKIINFLLAGYRHPDTDVPLAGGTITVTDAGTSNTAYVWDDRDKTLPTTTGRSTITLDAYGKAEVYGDGLYKLVIKDSGGVTVETIDYFEVLSINSGGLTVPTKAALSAVSTVALADNTSAYMQGESAAGDGGQGHFYWDSSDLSAQVAADTQSDTYVAPDADTTGASGAWVREIPEERETDPRYLDSSTGDLFSSRRAPYLGYTTAWQDVLKTKGPGSWTPTIICYGDSNTRYYQGDTATTGPVQNAYSTFLDILRVDSPHLAGASIVNAGYPSQTIQYGIDNFTANVITPGADIVVLGWGTNDIKLTGASVESYMTKLETLLNLAFTNNIVPIVLGIPWFSSDYGADGVTSQQRIPVWNSRMKALCEVYGVTFIDTYTAFKDAPATFYNEATTRRHYSAEAQNFIARKIYSALVEISPLGSGSRFAMRQEMTPEAVRIIKEATYDIIPGFVQYEVGEFALNTLKIPSGESITIKTAGRFLLGFYPRATATATITGVHVNTTHEVTQTTLDGLFYPLDTFLKSSGPGEGDDTVTIAASGGDLYLWVVCSERTPATFTSAVQVSGATLPSNPVSGRAYYVSDLSKPVYRTSVSGVFRDESGWRAVGATSDRTFVEAFIPKGFKFWDTDTASGWRWDGTAWVAL